MINWQIYTFDEVNSTNDVIKDFCLNKKQFVVVRALRQTAGRGRRGRSWQSLNGNLFFSLALEISLDRLGILVVATSLSLWQCIKNIRSDADVWLKWPNDVLINNAKVSGMLLEKGPEDYMIIGIGVNIVQHPEGPDMLYPTTSLQKAGIKITAADFMEQYLQYFAQNFEHLHNGEDEILRQEWLSCAKNIGKPIVVRQEQDEQHGIFAGIDENANLLLEKENEICHIRVGDVFYIENKE